MSHGATDGGRGGSGTAQVLGVPPSHCTAGLEAPPPSSHPRSDAIRIFPPTTNSGPAPLFRVLCLTSRRAQAQAPPTSGLEQSDQPAALCSSLCHAPSPPGAIRISLPESAQAPPPPRRGSPSPAEITPWPRPSRAPPSLASFLLGSGGGIAALCRARRAAAMAVATEGARRKERVLCLFDVDGTLTPARQVRP